jgi:RNA polymerase sigma-70 factor (ECF subfamily)
MSSNPDAEEPVDASMALVYDELRALARSYLARERPGHTLAPTDLVHEAFSKLAEQTGVSFANRPHLLATAARAMREILVDHARAKLTAKRGGGAARITLNEELYPGKSCDLDLLALDEALRRLSELDERKAKMVELRFFAGLSIEQTATVLGISHMTVSNDWRLARAWLASELESV